MYGPPFSSCPAKEARLGNVRTPPWRGRSVGIARVLGTALLAGLVAGCAPSTYLARRMVAAPNRVPDLVKPEGRVTLRWPDGVLERFPTGTNVAGAPAIPLRWVRVDPADYGLQTEIARREGGRHPGADIRFRFTLPETGLPPARSARGTVFVLHGYGMDLEVMFPWAIYLADAGWRVVLVDMRGHGRSGGRQVGFGRWETNDLRTLRDQLSTAGAWQGPTFALGHSLGAAVALRWASADPGLSGAVALAPFAEFPEAAERLRREYASWLPAGWVRRGVARIPQVLGIDAAALNPVDALRVGRTRGFVVAALDDRVAPPRDSYRLFRELAPGSRLITVTSATHETMPYVFDQHGAAIRQWLAGVGP